MDEGGFSTILKEAAERRRRFEELQKKLDEEDRAKAQQALEDRRRNRKQADERIRHPNYKPPPKRVHKKPEIAVRAAGPQSQEEYEQQHQHQHQHQQRQKQTPSQQRQRWAAAQEDARRRDAAEQLRAARRVDLRGFLAQQREQSHAPASQPLDWPPSPDSQEAGPLDACAGSKSPARVQRPALCWQAVKKEAQQGFQELMRQAGLPVNAGFSRPSSFSVRHKPATQPLGVPAHTQEEHVAVAHYPDSMLRELGLLEANLTKCPAVERSLSVAAAEESQSIPGSVTAKNGKMGCPGPFHQPPSYHDAAGEPLHQQVGLPQPDRSVSPSLAAVSQDGTQSKQLRLMRLNSDTMASMEGLISTRYRPFPEDEDASEQHEQHLVHGPAKQVREAEPCEQEADACASQVQEIAQPSQQPVLQWVWPDRLDCPTAQPPVQQDSAMALPWQTSCSQGGSASLQTCFSLLGSSSGLEDPADGDLPRLDSPAWETMLDWDSTEGHSKDSSNWGGLAGSIGSAVSTNSCGATADRLTGLEQGVHQLQQLKGDIEQGLAGQLGCNSPEPPSRIGVALRVSCMEQVEQGRQGKGEAALQAREPTLAFMGGSQLEADRQYWEAEHEATIKLAAEHDYVNVPLDPIDSKQVQRGTQQPDQQAAADQQQQQHHQQLQLTSLMDVTQGPAEGHQASGAGGSETVPQQARSFLQQAYTLISRLKNNSRQASSPDRQVHASGLHTTPDVAEVQLSGCDVIAAAERGMPRPAAAVGEPSSSAQQCQPFPASAVGAASPRPAVAPGSDLSAPGASNRSETFLHRVSRQLMQAGSHPELQGMLGSRGSHSGRPQQQREQSSPHALLTAQQGWDIWEQQRQHVTSWVTSMQYQPAAAGPVMPRAQLQQQQPEQQPEQLQQAANICAVPQPMRSMGNQATYQHDSVLVPGAWQGIPALQQGCVAANDTGFATGSLPHQQVHLESAWSGAQQQQCVAQLQFQQQQHNQHAQKQRDHVARANNPQAPTYASCPPLQQHAYQQPFPGTSDYQSTCKPTGTGLRQPAGLWPPDGQLSPQPGYVRAAPTTTTQNAAKRPAGGANAVKPDAPRKHEGSYVQAARLAKERAVRDETERKELKEQSQALRAAAKQRLKQQSKQVSNHSPPRDGTIHKSTNLGTGARLGSKPAHTVAAPAASPGIGPPAAPQQQAALPELVHRDGFAAVVAAAASPPCDSYRCCPREPGPIGAASQVRPGLPAAGTANPGTAGDGSSFCQPVQAADSHGLDHGILLTGQPRAASPQQGAKCVGTPARLLRRLGGRGKKGQAAQLLKLAADEKMLSEHEGLVRQSLARLDGQLAARGLPSSDLDSALTVAPRANSLMQLRLNKSIARLDGQLAGVLPAKHRPTPPVGKPLGSAAATPCKNRRVKPAAELDKTANAGASGYKQPIPPRQHEAVESTLQQRQAVRLQQAAPMGNHPGQSAVHHETTGVVPCPAWQQVGNGAGPFYAHAQPLYYPASANKGGTAGTGALIAQQVPVAAPRHSDLQAYQHVRIAAAPRLPQQHSAPHSLGSAHNHTAAVGQTHAFSTQQATAPLGHGPPRCNQQPEQGRVPAPLPSPQHSRPSRLQPVWRLGQHKKQSQPVPEQPGGPGRLLQRPTRGPCLPREAFQQGTVPAWPQPMLPPLGAPGSQAGWGDVAPHPGGFPAPQAWPNGFAGVAAGYGLQQPWLVEHLARQPQSSWQLPPVQQRAQHHIHKQQWQHMAALCPSRVQQQGVPWHLQPPQFMPAYL